MGGLFDPWRWPVYASQAVALFFVATLVFDVIHYILHRFLNSRYLLIRRIGLLHQAHHDFFGRQLDFDDRLVRDNLVKHVIPEYLNQVVITASALVILEPMPVAAALLFETAIFLGVVRLRGKDRNHIPYDVIPASGGTLLGLLVTPAYHALHHVFPDRYYSSWITLFDRLAGTASQIRGRRVAMTGASGAFGAPLKALLEREGAAEVRTLKHGRDYTYDDYGRLDDALREAEVLVLCHGSKSDHAMEANCDSFVALIERFRAVRRSSGPGGGLGGRLGDRGAPRLRHPRTGALPRLQAGLRAARASLLWRSAAGLPPHRPLGVHVADGPRPDVGVLRGPGRALLDPPRVPLRPRHLYGCRLLQLFQVPESHPGVTRGLSRAGSIAHAAPQRQEA